MGFAVSFTALFYMAAHVLQSPPLTALAKEELAALILSALIVAFWFGMDGFLSAGVQGLLMAAEPSFGQYTTVQPGSLVVGHLDLANASLELLFVRLKQMYTSLYLFEALIGFLSTMSFPVASPLPAVNLISFSFMPFDGLSLLSNAHTIVVEAIGYLMMVAWSKQFILLFARDTIPIILLPFGIVCRAFPFFRTTGSSIIAICIAAYFVLPLAVILSNYLIFDVYQPADFVYAPKKAGYIDPNDPLNSASKTTTEAEHQAKELSKVFTSDPLTKVGSTSAECGGSAYRRAWCSVKNIFLFAGTAISSFFTTAKMIWVFMSGLAGDFWSNMFSLTTPFSPTSTTAGLYRFIIQEVTLLSQFLVLVVFTSVLEIIITITIYRNIAMLIGGEAELAGLTKLV